MKLLNTKHKIQSLLENITYKRIQLLLYMKKMSKFVFLYVPVLKTKILLLGVYNFLVHKFKFDAITSWRHMANNWTPFVKHVWS